MNSRLKEIKLSIVMEVLDSSMEELCKSVKTLRDEENNRKFDQFVIKQSLCNSVLLREKKTEFLFEIQERVENISKSIQRMSFAVNLLVRDEITSKRDLREVTLPDFLSTTNDTFICQLMKPIENANKPIPYLVDFLKKREMFLPPLLNKKHQGHSNSVVTAAKKYIVNYRNYLVTNFKQFQERFVNVWGEFHNIPENERYFLRYLINGWPIPPRSTTPAWISEQPNHVVNMVKYHRQILKLQDVMLGKKWLKNNYETIIVYYFLLSKYFEKKSKKQLLLAPVTNMKAVFLHLDTDCFYGILKQLEMTHGNLKTFKQLQYEQWASVFDIRKNLTRNQRNIYEFTGTVETDGVSLCIHYWRPKLKREYTKKKYIHNPEDRIIGNDPGRVVLFYGAELLENGKYKHYKLSKAQFYEDSGINRANKKTKFWNSSIQTELDEISRTTQRSLSSETFIDYINSIRKNYEILWGEYLQKKWSKQRFNLYGGKKRVYDLFFKSLDDGSGKRLVIAYGDAGFKSTNKNEISAPTTRIRKECSKWYKTTDVDEYRTTQFEYKTDTKLTKVNESEKNRKVRGLLWCCSTNSSKFVSRDKNASEGIEQIGRTGIVPYNMKRTSPKIEDPVCIKINSPRAMVSKKDHRRSESSTYLNLMEFEYLSSPKIAKTVFHNVFV